MRQQDMLMVPADVKLDLLQAVTMFQHLQWAVQRELKLKCTGFCSPVSFTSCLQAIYSKVEESAWIRSDYLSGSDQLGSCSLFLKQKINIRVRC